MDIIAGTAGHIDHGKTALIKALTGTNTDRLPEEKQRGITIDLGFAELDLGETRIGFIDVPGHERFVKNMLAGAQGIDLVILVVAADEGVMPQTREHFQICRLLGVNSGLVVLTKSDLIDDEMLEIVRMETAELVEGSFLEGAPVIAASSKTGEGIGEIKNALLDLAEKVSERIDDNVTRLPIDRSFTIKGFGAVVTGTLLSGEIAAGNELELLPDGRRVRVRGVQTHSRPVDAVSAGQRAAINLAGIEHTEIKRGMVLAEKGIFRPTQIIDVSVEILKDAKRALRSRRRVRVHIGTVEALGRVQVLNEAGEIAQGESDLVQLRLEIPVVAAPGDRFVIRSYSPQTTIAGGHIIDALAKKHRRKDITAAREFLDGLNCSREVSGKIRLFVENAGESGLNFSDLQAKTGWRPSVLADALEKTIANTSIVKAGEYYLAVKSFEDLKARAIAAVGAHHKREPLSKGINRETLREKEFRHTPPDVFKAVLDSIDSLAQEGDIIRLASHSAELRGEEKIVFDRLRAAYTSTGFEVPKLNESLAAAIAETSLDLPQGRKVFQLLLNSGEIVKISEDFYFSRRAIDGLVVKMRECARSTPDRLIDVPKFKEIAGISRKYAIPLLEYFDRERVTRRAGDKRVIL